jgi:ActR/RegA family two-component response regulator
MMRVLERGQHDTVVVDPGVSGCLWYSLLNELRKAARGAALHVATAFASSALSRHAGDVEALSFFIKPTPIKPLVSAILGGGRRWANLRFPASLAAIEWEAVNEALYHYRGNATLAARRLRIPRQTLYRKLRKYSPVETDDAGYLNRRADTSQLNAATVVIDRSVTG